MGANQLPPDAPETAPETAPQTAPVIRRLTGSDDDDGSLGLLRQLNAVFADAFGDDGAAYRNAPPDDTYCRSVLGKEHVIVLTAVDQGTVIGGLVAYELDKLEQARREVYIYDLAVAAAHRRHGIATRLIRRLQAIADQRGAWAAFVQADHGDDAAIALYSRLGTREDVLHFDLAVP